MGRTAAPIRPVNGIERAQIQTLFFGTPAASNGVAAPPCRQQPPFTVQGETTQFPHVKPSAAGTGPIG